MSCSLADVLDQVAAVAASAMDCARPSDEEHECPFCDLKASDEQEHDPDCAYRIARTQLAPADVAEVRRLARVLRYVNGSAA